MNAITFKIDYKALAIELAPVLADEIEQRGILKPDAPDMGGIRWTRKQVLEHLGISETTLLRYEKTLPSFPRRVNDGGQPRWLATEIIAYGEGRYSCAATS